MCGIAGFWRRGATAPGDARATDDAIVRRMTDAITHRGPDADGVWLGDEAAPALGHRRLSILDLSPCGAQPMESAGGRWIVVFNGEIYNFRALRDELAAAGATFRGHSDTEVLLAAVERWGVHDAIRRCAGMFALALWDRAERTLHLVRDRLGEKPLYHATLPDGTLLFGSELKALRAHPGWRGTIDRQALALYLRHSYVPGPLAIYEGVRKVVPGTVVSFRAGAAAPEVVPYWSALEGARRGLASPIGDSPAAAVDALDAVLREVVGEEMVADVPLGAFLSGGIDSSTIVALMQAQSARPVRTFTIGFHEKRYNEAEHARAVAAHLGTDHTELFVTPADALAVVPDLPRYYDEPFADPSQIPTYLVSALARQHVTVALSGDGGDEGFAGYNRYFWGERLWGALGRVPRPLRRGAARAIQGVPPRWWDRAVRAARGGGVFGHAPGDRIHKLAGILAVPSAASLYRELSSTWVDAGPAVLGVDEVPSPFAAGDPLLAAFGLVPGMQLLDLQTYLPDDILVKVDRAAMAVSLETRAPFLDHRVIEFAWRVPLALKVREGKGKWLVRQLLYRYVPQSLVDRPKQGFGVPVEEWLRGPLRDWAGDLLAPDRLRRDGYLDAARVQRLWDEHRSGARNWQYALWNVLMFQAWLDAA